MWESCGLHETILVELEIIPKHGATVIAMAMMKFQYGRHFSDKRILLVKKARFHKMFLPDILDYRNKYKKILKKNYSKKKLFKIIYAKKLHHRIFSNLFR